LNEKREMKKKTNKQKKRKKKEKSALDLKLQGSLMGKWGEVTCAEKKQVQADQEARGRSQKRKRDFPPPHRVTRYPPILQPRLSSSISRQGAAG